MPELPEVETVCRVLGPQLCGRRIERAELFWPGVAAHPDAAALAAGAAGRTVAAMQRRGKYMSLVLDDGAVLRVHLRMTGRLVLAPAGWPAPGHTHAVFFLDDGSELRFADPRRFGRLWLLAPGEADVYSGIARLGPEPFDPALTAAYLRAVCGRSRAAVKSCLLDQSVVAGIGNIYSDEILFAARIRPGRPACTLTGPEWARLAAEIPACLGRYTEWNAISPADYLAGGGTDYRNTPHLQVYGHAGAPCPRCGRSTLQRAVLAGRSSVYCPRCQPPGRRK